MKFERGSRIDEVTTGFTIGRMAQWLLADGTSDPGAFRAGPELFEVVERACRPAREERFSSIAALHDAWKTVRP